MVLIPAGEFLIGSPESEIEMLLKNNKTVSKDFFKSEQPQHSVYLENFYIDRYEVTNDQYQRFIESTGYAKPKYWHTAPSFGSETPFPIGNQNLSHPVVGVSWYDATAYCAWAGKRLVTEAEWEKAARGGMMKVYPWGNELSHDMANYGGIGGKDQWQWTAPVGSFPPNSYGLYDMAGNVFEWCINWYDENYYSHSPKRNPSGAEKGITKVARGGSWDNNRLGIYYMRSTFRFHVRPETKNLFIGFRCAKDVPAPR